MTIVEELAELVDAYGMGPSLEEMERNTLSDKWIDGATAAHRIEEIHTPLNIAYLTTSTGTSAFQNIIGVSYSELPDRIKATLKMLKMLGIKENARVLISYPPLVNVLYYEALRNMNITVLFPKRPSRDALLAALCKERPDAVFGEASFLLTAFRDARKMGITGYLPENLLVVCAGTPFLPEILNETEKLSGASLHDMYGCQEYGPLCLDGVPLREDLAFLPIETPRTNRNTQKTGGKDIRYHVLVGGLPIGDIVQMGEHILNSHGTIMTNKITRAEEEPLCEVVATTSYDRDIVRKTCRSILRLKGHVIKIGKQMATHAECTEIAVTIPESGETFLLKGEKETRMWDSLMEAQKQLLVTAKNDPVWNKKTSEYMKYE